MKFLTNAAFGAILGGLALGAGIGALAGLVLALPFIIAIKSIKAAKALPAAIAVLRGPKGIWLHRLYVSLFVLAYPIIFLIVGAVHAAQMVPADWRAIRKAWSGAWLKAKAEADDLLPWLESEGDDEAAEIVALTEGTPAATFAPGVEPEAPAPAEVAPVEAVEAPEAAPVVIEAAPAVEPEAPEAVPLAA
jgi:hypothetical protein